MPVIHLNGRFLEQSEAALDPLDRGMLLGDGVFETIRCEEGQLLFHVAHFARLARDARILEIPWNRTNEEMLQICQQVLDANGLRRARLRLTLTRGEGSTSPEIAPGNTPPTLLIHAAAVDQEHLDRQRATGWTLAPSAIPVNHRSPLATVKTTSYVERLLARREARRHGADEALMLNTDGLVAEGAMTNLFAIRGEEVLTPPVEDGALPGIMRMKIGLLCPRLGLRYREMSITREELESAETVFCTNAVLEMMPVAAVGGRKIQLPGKGSVFHRLFQEHRRDIEQFLGLMRGG